MRVSSSRELRWSILCAFFLTYFCNPQCGHDALSPISWVNAVIGIGLHTFVLTPYYAWRITHRNHHVRASSYRLIGTYTTRVSCVDRLTSYLSERYEPSRSRRDLPPFHTSGSQAPRGEACEEDRLQRDDRGDSGLYALQARHPAVPVSSPNVVP